MTVSVWMLLLTKLLLLGGVLGASTDTGVIKEDLKHIKCDVCKTVANTLWNSISEMVKDLPPGKKHVEEIEIIEVLDTVCNPENSTVGDWMRRLDITVREDGNTKHVVVVEPGGKAKCGAECATMAKSCNTLLEDDLDSQDDVLAALYKRKMTLDKFEESMCKKWSSRCKKESKGMPLTFQRLHDEEFVPMSEKDIQMEDMMAMMKSMGMGGQMMGRDQMMDQMMDENDDEDMLGDGYQAAYNDMMGDEF